jgi:hypothetical protein
VSTGHPDHFIFPCPGNKTPKIFVVSEILLLVLVTLVLKITILKVDKAKCTRLAK